MAELVDAHDSKSCGVIHGSSILPPGTMDRKTESIKILVLLGPTATGKSKLAVELAQKFNGEVISADSRQVYKDLNIGTGKITKEEMNGIQHHLLDIVDPSTRFTVHDWKKQAVEIIKEIHSRGKLPIVCGGTGFYISALIDDLQFPEIEIDPDEQKELENKSAEDLFIDLNKLDPIRAASMQHDGEDKNKRRLARSILIARTLGKVPPNRNNSNNSNKYDSLFIGLTIPDDKLKERVNKRLAERINNGMIEEAEELNKKGLSYVRMNELGLEYKYLAEYLQGRINKDQLMKILSIKIWQYAKRQKTWFKRDKRIHWFNPEDSQNQAEIEKLITSFLSSS
jgi:tRNA dimethylallyltransferase